MTAPAPFDFSPAPGSGHYWDRAAQWYGLSPLPVTWCPRRAAGLRHLTARPCICRGHYLLDHPHLWRTSDGRTVYTAEPYGIDGPALAALSTEAADIGLTVTTYPVSMWNPGRTLLLVLSSADYRYLPLTFRPSEDAARAEFMGGSGAFPLPTHRSTP